jgi:hypothetical protein
LALALALRQTETMAKAREIHFVSIPAKLS